MEFISVIISGDKVCKFLREENMYFLSTKYAPHTLEFDEKLKNKYGMTCVHKEEHENIWLITVHQCVDDCFLKWISFETFLKHTADNSFLNPICAHIFEKKKSLSIKLQYGLRDNKIISIWDLKEEDRGLKCNCVCPGCGIKLLARLGSGKKQRHFSHDKDAKCNIQAAQQTALHILAKEIIEEEKTVKFPPVVMPFEQTNSYKKYGEYLRLQHLYHAFDLPDQLEYKKASIVNFDSVTLEKKVSSFIPDVIAFKGDKPCIIEIAVTHFIDENKEKKIKELKLPVLEIDISSLMGEVLDKEVLKDIIINKIENKKWVYNPKWEPARIWADNQYEKTIKEINEKIDKEERIRQKQIKLEEEKRMQKEKKKEAGIKALKNSMNPQNYREIVLKLRDNNAYNTLYRKLYIYKESKNPPFYLDIPITGEFIFDCDRRIWQTLIFDKYVYNGNTEDVNVIYISFNKISHWITKLQKNFKINWDFSYKTEINNKKYNLLRDVVLQYLFYLKELGFIQYEFYPYGGEGCVISPHNLTPPNKDYAISLKNAIKNIDGTLPNVNEKISEWIEHDTIQNATI